MKKIGHYRKVCLISTDNAILGAGKIHSDIERGFIRAEIYKYKDLVELGSYKAIQEAKKITLEGKDYEMQEGDVVYFRFSV